MADSRCGASIRYDDDPPYTCQLTAGHKGAHFHRVGRMGITWCSPLYFTE